MQRFIPGTCHPAMKYSIILLCFAAMTVPFSSCEKNEAPKAPFSDSISGTWELRQMSAAMNPNVTELAPGNGNLLKFEADNYQKYESGNLIKNGKFEVVGDPTVESSVCLLFPIGQFTNRIVFDNDNTSDKQFIQITDGRLIIVAGCYAYDAGHRREYVKIAETEMSVE